MVMTGVPGWVSGASTVRVRLPLAAVPAWLVTVAVTVVVPEASALSASAGTVMLQLPSPATLPL